MNLEERAKQYLETNLEDETNVVTFKSLAYALNIPILEAQKILEDYSTANKNLFATWSLVSKGNVIQFANLHK